MRVEWSFASRARPSLLAQSRIEETDAYPLTTTATPVRGHRRHAVHEVVIDRGSRWSTVNDHGMDVAHVDLAVDGAERDADTREIEAMLDIGGVP